jgi:hypothetical protein
MLVTFLKIGGLLAVVAIGGEFLTPPLSCWLAKGSIGQEAGGPDGGRLLLLQPAGGVGAAIRRLAEPPPNLPGAACRAALLRLVGLG